MKFLNQVLGDIDVFHVFLMGGGMRRGTCFSKNTFYLLEIQYSR